MKPTALAVTALLTLPLFSSLARAQSEFPSPAEPTSGPSAEAKQEAARRFEHAVKLYEEADYQLALAEFERVYELVPQYRVLYNIGQVNMQLGKYAKALLTLREYLRRGGAELPSDRVEAVRADLEQLAARTAALSVSTEPPGCEVWLDGKLVGNTPLAEPLVVDVGERRLEVRKAGYSSRAQSLSLAGGDAREVKVALALEPARSSASTPQPVAPPLRPVRPAPAPERGGSWGWVGYTAAGALAAGAVVSGALGASAASDLDDLRRSPGASRHDLDDAQSRARSRLLVADILGAAALVTGSVTLYFQLSAPRHDERGAATTLGVALAPSAVTFSVSH